MSQVRVLYPPPQWRISSVGRAPIKNLNLCLGKFIIQEPEKQKFQKPETQTNVRLADLKAITPGCGGIGRHARLRIQCLCVRVQVSSPGPKMFVQATTFKNKQPTGSSLLLAKLPKGKYRKSGAESRHYHPPLSRLHRHKEEAARTDHWEPLSPTKYLGSQLIWESACLASRRWRVRASLGPP